MLLENSDISECGISPFKPLDPRARLVGGEIADKENWPWVVRILVNGRYITVFLNNLFIWHSGVARVMNQGG